MGLRVNVDLLSSKGAQGELAAYLAANGRMDAGSLRPWIGDDGRSYLTVYKGGDRSKPDSYQAQPIQTNATLRRDEWKHLDEAVLKIAEKRLVGIQDLTSRGLVYTLNGMGTTVLEYHDISDALIAEITMDGVSRAKGDRINYEAVYLPLPIIHADYEINARVLAVSRNLGNPLDTTMAERAARKVNEALENMLFTAPTTPYTFGGGTIYSYVNHPGAVANKVTMAKLWDAVGTTAAEILADVIAMKQKSIDAFHYGPWVLYIPTSYETTLDADYSSAADAGRVTIRQRIETVGGIEDVKVADSLPVDTCVLVQMTSDVVRLVQGMGIQNVEWQTEGKMVTKYKVMTIQVPQIRYDQEQHCGVVLLEEA